MNQVPSAQSRAADDADNAMDGMPMKFGKYTLIRKLASGGMAELFLAIQRSVAGFEKLIVIKRILPQMNQDRGFIDMLLHEARVAATLSHPNIVQIFDVGEVDGVYYIAMEHVHGEDIRSVVRQMKKKGVREFPMEHALSILLGMCAGLAYAHERSELDGTPLNIVHRDISPQNVVVTFSGDVKIVDFGIAKSDRASEHTEAGKLKGKVPYMSPEQARGQDVDSRSDIFSAGVMLFELTTGKRLFKGPSEFETLKMICESEYPLPSKVRPGYPAELEKIVIKALAKERVERYQTAREMQAALEEFIRTERIAASHIALNHFMQNLFEEKLASQKEALLQGKQLADIIEMQHISTRPPPESTNELEAAGSTSSQSVSLPGRTITPVERARTVPPKGRNNLPVLLIGGITAIVIGSGAGYWLVKRQSHAAQAALDEAVASTRGALHIESTPSGAAIWIDGDLKTEKTPATFYGLPAQAIDVKLTKDGFETARSNVLIKPEETAEWKPELTSSLGSLTLTLNPPGVSITFDGKAIDGGVVDGVTSKAPHTLVATAAGFDDKTISVTLEPGEKRELAVTLDAIPVRGGAHRPAPKPTPSEEPAQGGTGKLNVAASGGWCNIAVDGAPRGPTPVAGIELSSGNHKVTCTTADGKVQTLPAAITPNGSTRIKFSL